MQELTREALEAVSGGDADGCPITNRSNSPMTIYSPESRRWTDVGVGETAKLPVESSVFYPRAQGSWRQSNVEGCQPGRAFEIVPNSYNPDMPITQRTAG